jgi:hypothetical protein
MPMHGIALQTADASVTVFAWWRNSYGLLYALSSVPRLPINMTSIVY